MAAEVGLSVLGKMAELLIDPIQRELGYLFCFNNNFQELETLLQDLKAARNDEQRREDAGKKKQKTLGDKVNRWIEKADIKIVEAEHLINEKADIQKGCFSIKWCPNISLRFSLGRKGKKLSLVLIDLLQSGGQLPNEALDLPMSPIDMRDYNGDARDFDSRSQIMEDVIEMLRDKETMLIGICGMGGIGKTTFARQVLQKVNDSHKHLFEIQVICTVSNSPNFNAIQQQVAEMLGFSLKDVESEILRAQRLRNSLSNKKVVVLLDDVWENFDLNAFGFPLTKSDAVGCCKIIYTSRTQGLWLGERTITKKEIALELLTWEESWNLFKRKVDLQDDDIDLRWKNETARKIVEECGLLPLALGVVGGALIEKDKHEWENMLYQLRNQGQDQHTDKINKVLETSYHFLNDRNAQFLFLLCCLFREDEIIPIETLFRYAVGLQLLNGINVLQRTRVLVYTLLDNLIRRNLVIKSGECAVKMHDLVREVGISIAKQEKNDIHFLECDGVNELENIVTTHSKMISIYSQKNEIEVLDKIAFRGSKSELLRLVGFGFRPNIKISGNSLFQGEDNFKVLDVISTFGMISEFPLFSSLAKLRMLSLEGLSLDMTINLSSIEHIKCLEILSLRKSSIKVLPNEISELTNLKLLDLTECNCSIRKGVLSRLTHLEELYMWDSFQDWRLQKENVNGGDRNAAGLDELNCLHKLWRLELEVPNIEQVPRDVRLFSSSTLLEQFKIRVGGGKYIKFESGERQLWLENVEDNTNFLQEFGFLIEKDITNFYLCADSGMLEKMYLNNFHLSLKDIVLKRCGSLFPSSQSKSSHISNKEEIYIGRNFRRIEIYECNQMRHLCSTSISRNLINLQALVLQECEMIEEVVSFCDKRKQLNKIEFNALETLKLRDLSRLECFCKGINMIHFHKLKTLELKGLKKFIIPTKLEIPYLEELSIVSMPNIKTLFNIVSPTLQKLNIDNCDDFQYLDFSNSMTMKVISHLKSLTITSCKRLKGVIGVTTSAEEQRKQSIEFPNLLILYIKFLDELASFVIEINNLGDKEEKSQSALFYHDDYQVSFPSLREFIINGLSKINCIVGMKSGQVGGHHDDIVEGHGREIQQSIFLFPNLKKLELVDLEELVSFVGVMNNMDNNCKIQNALFHMEDDEVSFPCLRELTLQKLAKINYIIGKKERLGHHTDDTEDMEIQPPILLFPNLKILKLDHLEELLSFVGVITSMGDNLEKQNTLFHFDDHQISFPCLRELLIMGLSKINYIVGWKEGGRHGEKGYHHLHNHKIFPVLSELRLFHLNSLIHMYEINQPGLLGVLLFQNLEFLTVNGCGKLRYLFSENIGRVAAKHLQWLDIYNCGMMEVVMKKDEDGIDDDKFGGSNSVGNSHFFPLLWYLYLMNLSGLMSFSDVAYTWVLPSLDYLRVEQCPKLEAISPGYLDSPRLNILEYSKYEDREKVNVKNTWKGNVNSALTHLFIKTQKQEDEEDVEKEQPAVERLESMDDELVNKEAIN